MDAAGIYSIPCTSAYLLAFYFSFETVPEATITITEKIMGQLEISAGELWDAAREHALKNFWFSDLAKIVEDETEDGTYEETDESQRLYVLTNLQHNLGSGLIAFQEIQELVYRELGDREYYVLPSSIHELIIARRDIGMTRAQMESVVRQVNQNVVENVNLPGSEILRYRHGAGIEIMR